MIGLWMYLACQPAPTGLANGDIASIRVEPTELTLVTTPDEPAEAEFVAFATMADGTELEMDLLSWKVSNFSAGDIDEDGIDEIIFGEYRSIDENWELVELNMINSESGDIFYKAFLSH